MHTSYSQEYDNQMGSVCKRDSLPGSAKSNFSAITDGSGGSGSSPRLNTSTTAKKGLPWWKLARPVRLGRRRSLAELSANNVGSRCIDGTSQQEKQQRQHTAPSSGEGLFCFERDIPSTSLFSSSSSSKCCSAWSEERRACPKKHHQHQQSFDSSHGTFVGSYSGTESTEDPYPREEPQGKEKEAERDGFVAHHGDAEPDASADAAPGRTSVTPVWSGSDERFKATDRRYPAASTLRGHADDSNRSCESRGDDDPTDPQVPRTPTTPGARVCSSPYDTADAPASVGTIAFSNGTSDARQERGYSHPDIEGVVVPAVGGIMNFDFKKEYEKEGIDDETALNRPSRPRVLYDILAVDRGCGNCDTSVVPFPVNDNGEVATRRMRAVTSGQGEFLARRGFASGLVAHFLEETNSEFRVLQGETSAGMDAEQLEEAAVCLEEAFEPAVKRLRVKQSTEVVLDSLFEGVDDAGPFVVRFEVTITRCHPEDLEASSANALQLCAPAIREVMNKEGVMEREMHEVVFVGRPMWELVSPVLDLSNKAAEATGSSG